jgi:hypothetical protein
MRRSQKSELIRWSVVGLMLVVLALMLFFMAKV